MVHIRLEEIEKYAEVNNVPIMQKRLDNENIQKTHASLLGGIHDPFCALYGNNNGVCPS